MRFSYASGSRPLEGYTIKRGIGVGGFGEVYFALNDAGKEVALKKIQRNLDIELRGVRHCLNLKHVNLISLWDIRTNEFGESWVVMEYVPGPSLRDVVEAYPNGMKEAHVKRWFASTASGVAYLHEHGIVHRDLKPGNIFHDQDEQVIKIGDYGLSKFISCSRRSGQTESVGTFHYMAPEIGKGEYGKEIDIYAMGIILFEMLTGLVPFDGESTQEIIMKHLTMDADVSVVPEPFKRVISKSLRKDPQKRYRSIAEMVGELPWPEIAAKPDNIIRRHSVGPIPMGAASEPHTISTAEHPGSPDSQAQPVESEDVGAPEIVSKLPPVIIDGRSVGGPIVDENQPEGIHFGPVTDSSHARRKAAATSNPDARAQRSVKNDAEIQFLDQRIARPHPDVEPEMAETDPFVEKQIQQERGESDPSTGSRKTLVATNQAVMASNVNSATMPNTQSEPIAVAVRSGLTDLSRWWASGKVSAPVRLVALIVLGIVLIQNSKWLLPVIISLAILYLVYFAVRRYALSPREVSSLPTESEILRSNEGMIRSWLAARPSTDQVTELVGSMLIGAIGSIALSLLGMALLGFRGSVEVWAVFTWQTLIAVAAVWSVLVVTKYWSLRPCRFSWSVGSDFWLRFGMIVCSGALIGAIAFFSAGSFEIDLARLASEDFAAKQTSGWVLNLMPKFPAMMLAFAGLFGLARFGSHTDRLRRTRLSILNVVICLAVAALLSHGLNVPLTVMCVLGAVMSITVQLASPWMHPDEQLEVCRTQSELAPKS
ncbi:MAG: serine/threonine-protein kinase [Planctomycetota bacterium]